MLGAYGSEPIAGRWVRSTDGIAARHRNDQSATIEAAREHAGVAGGRQWVSHRVSH